MGSNGRRRLEQERGLADARLAAQKHGRALRQPAACCPVQLADARNDAGQWLFLVREGLDLRRSRLTPRLEPGGRASEIALPSWLSEFQAPQAGHLPCHLEETAPQDWQT